MTHKSSFTPLATALACALLAGCNLAPQYQAPPLPVPETVAPPLPPDSSPTQAVPLAEAGPMQWQDFVQEPRLRQLVGLVEAQVRKDVAAGRIEQGVTVTKEKKI